MFFPLGGQRVGIVTETAGSVSEFMEPTGLTGSVAWVDGCLFESWPSPTEQQALTVTTSDYWRAYMPVADGAVPTTKGPMAVVDITANLRLRHDDIDYVMRGDAVLERDIRGRQDHVYCLVERQTI